MAKWNPLLHPRGRDGRFIEVYGWVRWLSIGGRWVRGQVVDIDGESGVLKIHVDGKPDRVKHIDNPSRVLYAAPKPKAKLKLPKIGAGEQEGWAKVGSQAGSNKGGRFKATVAQTSPLTKAQFNDATKALDVYSEADDVYIGDKWAVARASDGRVATKISGAGDEPEAAVWVWEPDGNPLTSDNVKALIDNGDIRHTTSKTLYDDATMKAIAAAPEGTANVGDEYYVKEPKSKTHVLNEVLANSLYKLAGVPVPEVIADLDESRVGSKIIPAGKPLSDATPDELKRIREDFAVDAWLANWDTVGLALDNIVIADGVPTRIDGGGSLLYRAMGSPKGSMFGNEVGELESLRNPSINSQSASIFGPTTTEELQAGASRVAAIHPAQIRDMVEESSLPDSLADTLIARRADLLKKTGVVDPYLGGSVNAPPVAADPLPAVDVPEAPTASPGPLPDTSPEAITSTDPFATGVFAEGEFISGDDLKEPGFNLQALVGRTFVVTGAGYANSSGIFTVESATMSSIKFRGAGGTNATYPVSTIDGGLREVTNISAEELIATPKPTFKANGDIVLNGQVIGKHKKTWTGWAVELFAAHSATGKPYSKMFNKQSMAKGVVAARAIPPQLLSKPKTSDQKSLKDSIVSASAAATVAGKTSDGTDAVKGLTVASIKDGFEGKITGWPNQEKYPGLVYVQGKDGSKKTRNLKTLKAVAPASVPAPAGPVVKTKSGKQILVGQKVKAGKASSQVEGTVTKVNPANGYVYVTDADGKKHIKTSATVQILEDVDPDADVIAAATGGADLSATAKSTAKAVATSTAKYPGPDGAQIPAQAQDLKDNYLKTPGRKLNKDGFAPQVGMYVRDSKGELGIVVEVNTPWSSNPGSVKIFQPSTGKKVHRAWGPTSIDHSAELVNSDGEPVKMVKEISFATMGGKPVTPPAPGATLYSFQQDIASYDEEGNYQGSRPRTSLAWVNPGSKTVNILKENQFGDVQLSGVSASTFFESFSYSNSKKKKIGIYDPDGGDTVLAHAVLMHSYKKTAGGSIVFSDVSDQPADAASIIAKAAADKAFTSGTAPQIITDAMAVLPKPPDVDGEASAVGTVFPVTGAGADLDVLPPTLRGSKAHTITQAAQEMIELRSSTAVGTSNRYAIGDSHHVEDMAFRFQATKTQSDEQRLDARFRLIGQTRDVLAQQLITTKAAPTGGWVVGDPKKTEDLVEGDVIAIRMSSSQKVHKLGTKANARVLDKQQIGETAGGTAVYRVRFSTSDGQIGEIDLEARDTASVATYRWDPTFTAQVYGAPPADLSPAAAAAGWTVVSKYMTIPYQTGQVALDENGVATPVSGSAASEVGGGMTLQRVDPETGAIVRLTIIPPGHGKSGSHPNFDGEVRVSMKTSGASQADIDMAMSRAMESVGIPPMDQTSPDEQQIKAMAMAKIAGTFLPTWSRKRSSQSLAADVDQALARLSNELRQYMLRDVTLDDFVVRAHDTGRVQVVATPELAKAIAKRQGNKYYMHTGVSGVDRAVELLAGTADGLMSSDERFSLGVPIKGASSHADLRIGSGDRLYVTGKTTKLENQTFYGGTIIFAPVAINSSTEIYVNAGDNYGRRSSKNEYLTMGGGYEYMYKRRIEREQIAFVFHRDPDSVIKKLKARGVTHIGGRPIEQIILKEGKIPPELLEGFEDIGAIGTVGPKVGQLGTTMPTLEAAAPAPAGAVA